MAAGVAAWKQWDRSFFARPCSVFELKDELGLTDEAELVAGDALDGGGVLLQVADRGAELADLLVQTADLGVRLDALAAQIF
jgi:hypothetical protein